MKAYGFQVPKGTKSGKETKEGVDVYVGEVPKPHEIALMVVSYRDKAMKMDDLKKNAEDILKAFGESDIKIEKTEELAANYTLLTFTSFDAKEKKKSKGKRCSAPTRTTTTSCSSVPMRRSGRRTSRRSTRSGEASRCSPAAQTAGTEALERRERPPRA